MNQLEEAKKLYEFIKQNLNDEQKCLFEIIKYFTIIKIELLNLFKNKTNK